MAAPLSPALAGLIHEDILFSVGVEAKNPSSSQDSEQRGKPGVGWGDFPAHVLPSIFTPQVVPPAETVTRCQGNVACSFLGGRQPQRHGFLLKKIYLLARAKPKNSARIKPTFF